MSPFENRKTDLDSPLTRIAALVEELEQMPETPARESARALVEAVLEIHRAGLTKLIEIAAVRAGEDVVDELAADPSVALLLSLHELHPTSREARVRTAVDQLRPTLLAAGVAIETDGVGDDVARVRVRPAGTVRLADARLRSQIESAIYRGAPEIAMVEIDGLDDAPTVPVTRLSAPRE
ncbi:MAG TPA: hypothetical protein VGL13_05925 [Polyangiaceae bacterium]|jgi:hypothetical protein